MSTPNPTRIIADAILSALIEDERRWVSQRRWEITEAREYAAKVVSELAESGCKIVSSSAPADLIVPSSGCEDHPAVAHLHRLAAAVERGAE